MRQGPNKRKRHVEERSSSSSSSSMNNSINAHSITQELQSSLTHTDNKSQQYRYKSQSIQQTIRESKKDQISSAITSLRKFFVQLSYIQDNDEKSRQYGDCLKAITTIEQTTKSVFSLQTSIDEDIKRAIHSMEEDIRSAMRFYPPLKKKRDRKTTVHTSIKPGDQIQMTESFFTDNPTFGREQWSGHGTAVKINKQDNLIQFAWEYDDKPQRTETIHASHFSHPEWFELHSTLSTEPAKKKAKTVVKKETKSKNQYKTFRHNALQAHTPDLLCRWLGAEAGIQADLTQTPEEVRVQCVVNTYQSCLKHNRPTMYKKPKYCFENENRFLQLLQSISSESLLAQNHHIKQFGRSISIMDMLCHRIESPTVEAIIKHHDIQPTENCLWMHFSMGNLYGIHITKALQNSFTQQPWGHTADLGAVLPYFLIEFANIEAIDKYINKFSADMVKFFSTIINQPTLTKPIAPAFKNTLPQEKRDIPYFFILASDYMLPSAPNLKAELLKGIQSCYKDNKALLQSIISMVNSLKAINVIPSEYAKHFRHAITVAASIVTADIHSDFPEIHQLVDLCPQPDDAQTSKQKRVSELLGIDISNERINQWIELQSYQKSWQNTYPTWPRLQLMPAGDQFVLSPVAHGVFALELFGLSLLTKVLDNHTYTLEFLYHGFAFKTPTALNTLLAKIKIQMGLIEAFEVKVKKCNGQNSTIDLTPAEKLSITSADFALFRDYFEWIDNQLEEGPVKALVTATNLNFLEPNQYTLTFDLYDQKHSYLIKPEQIQNVKIALSHLSQKIAILEGFQSGILKPVIADILKSFFNIKKKKSQLTHKEEIDELKHYIRRLGIVLSKMDDSTGHSSNSSSSSSSSSSNSNSSSSNNSNGNYTARQKIGLDHIAICESIQRLGTTPRLQTTTLTLSILPENIKAIECIAIECNETEMIKIGYSESTLREFLTQRSSGSSGSASASGSSSSSSSSSDEDIVSVIKFDYIGNIARRLSLGNQLTEKFRSNVSELAKRPVRMPCGNVYTLTKVKAHTANIQHVRTAVRYTALLHSFFNLDESSCARIQNDSETTVAP